ncbi:hypothetical protein RD792_015850 [Penstemon davidsonii]|uniref:Uncharacterized protein n=1 Tax=Penstemon davidsonii TaxID=160366 RepID=A0ABR0CIG1_9LAMI|nr:hypothetical protein RD792_015850 [Penstemon davidsonii]
MGISCNMKKQVTTAQEFHFAVDKIIPPPTPVLDLFDKLSTNSDSLQEKLFPRNTTLNPFHLQTEKRGAKIEKKLEEEKAKIPKAHPYPYTTYYPVISPKPDPNHAQNQNHFNWKVC